MPLPIDVLRATISMNSADNARVVHTIEDVRLWSAPLLAGSVTHWFTHALGYLRERAVGG